MNFQHGPIAYPREQVALQLMQRPFGMACTPLGGLLGIPLQGHDLKGVAIGSAGFELFHLAHLHRISPL